jgi:DNA (cytosine-5)-methyltransferase 1
MSKPRLLDLFCGGGGASAGYTMAGFQVTGVDIVDRQGRFPDMDFVKGDALEYLALHGSEYDAIHASPPCQAFSISKHLVRKKMGRTASTLDLLVPTRRGLEVLDKPWIIENVPGAPLSGVVLCGTTFGLGARMSDGKWHDLYRHRIFESSEYLMGAGPCQHRHQAIGIYGSIGDKVPDGATMAETAQQGREAMGIDWPMPWTSVREAIPPLYAEWLGKQLLRLVQYPYLQAGAL